MNQEPDRIQKLVRLKRHETPPEGYFDGFLRDFHQRQRAELLKRSSLRLFFERLRTYFEHPGGEKWAYAPVMAIFSLAIFTLVAAASEPEAPAMPVADIGWGQVSLTSGVGQPAALGSERSTRERTVFAPDDSLEDIRLFSPAPDPEGAPLIPPGSRRFYR